MLTIATHKFLRRLCGALLLLGVLVGLEGQAAAPVWAASGDCVNHLGTLTCTYTYTGAAQSWTVPAGVTQATFIVDGAQGESLPFIDGTQEGMGGLGARVQATLAVSPGQIYQLMVGGAGSVMEGGFNGGGSGGINIQYTADGGGGGGGASDVRSGACVATLNCALADRRIIAGGGGGTGVSRHGGGHGGNGGQIGGDGTTSSAINTVAGTGGTATNGGTGGRDDTDSTPSLPGQPGELGQGGNGGRIFCRCYSAGGGGGGGGGLYGGGGGGGSWISGGGGGGSSFGPLAPPSKAECARGMAKSPSSIPRPTTPGR